MAPRALIRASVCAVFAVVLSGCVDFTAIRQALEGPPAVPETEMQAEDKGPFAVDGGLALDRDVVVHLQTRLARLGYEPGPVDGLVGRRTRGAVRRFQTDAGLIPDGRITEDLLTMLDVQPARGGDRPNELGKATTETAQEAPAPQEVSQSPLGPPPRYDVGSRFVYADGTVDRVRAVDGPMVRWESNRDEHFTTYHNFLVSPISWRGADTRGVRVSSPAPHRLWTLTGQREFAFTVTTYAQHGARPDNRTRDHVAWRCRLEGRERLELRAGVFEAQKLLCEGSKGGAASPLQRVWYYAPEIGHFVAREDTRANAPNGTRVERVELIAIQPGNDDWPPVVQAGLEKAIQHALETGKAGEAIEWASSAIDVDVTIRPGGTHSDDLGRTCRNFVQVWSDQGARRVYPALACRIASGRWLIPGLDLDTLIAQQPN